jgi:hypothetical protein
MPNLKKTIWEFITGLSRQKKKLHKELLTLTDEQHELVMTAIAAKLISPGDLTSDDWACNGYDKKHDINTIDALIDSIHTFSYLKYVIRIVDEIKKSYWMY